jgi:hypothetical protein
MKPPISSFRLSEIFQARFHPVAVEMLGTIPRSTPVFGYPHTYIWEAVPVELAEIFHTCVYIFLVFRSELRSDRIGDFNDDHVLIPLR